jgi:hypothetical protein
MKVRPPLWLSFPHAGPAESADYRGRSRECVSAKKKSEGQPMLGPFSEVLASVTRSSDFRISRSRVKKPPIRDCDEPCCNRDNEPRSCSARSTRPCSSARCGRRSGRWSCCSPYTKGDRQLRQALVVGAVSALARRPLQRSSSSGLLTFVPPATQIAARARQIPGIESASAAGAESLHRLLPGRGQRCLTIGALLDGIRLIRTGFTGVGLGGTIASSCDA